MMKENRRRDNKENEDNNLLEKMKERIRKMTSEDYEITEEKIERYEAQRPGKAIIDARVKGLVECPICNKVFTCSQWAVHRWKELHKTSLKK